MAELMGIIIPGSLAFIMFGMGMGLKVSDFTQLAKFPKAFGVGLVAQVLLLPVVAYGVIQLFSMPEVFAIGLLVIAMTPGGAVSNLWTFVAGGDIALSVTLTAFSSLLSVITVPLLLNFALLNLIGEELGLSLPVGKTMLHIAMITVIPVTLGMVVHARFAEFTRRTDKVVKVLSVTFLLVAIGGIIGKEIDTLGELMRTSAGPVLFYNALVMGLGFTAARLSKLPPRQVITISVEVGIQNVILSATLAAAPQFMGRTDIGLVPSMYGFTMSLMVLIFIGLIKFFPGILGHSPEPAPQSA